MAESQPPEFLGAECYTFADFRQAFGSAICNDGVADYADMKVTAVGGASLNVSVAAGNAWVEGDLNGSSGMYHIYNNGAVVMTIAANGAGSSRIDLIIASVYDSQYIGAADNWALEVVQGVAGAGTPAVPASTRSGYIVLGAVTVPASGGTPSTVSDTTRERMSTCGTPPYCELSSTGATSIPNNASTKVTLATTVHVDSEFFTVGSGVTASVITVLQDGLYKVSAHSGATSTQLAEIDFQIGHNGTTALQGTTVGAANIQLFYAHTERPKAALVAGATLELDCYQLQSTGAAAINTTSATGGSRLIVEKVG